MHNLQKSRRLWSFATKFICTTLSIIVNQGTVHSKTIAVKSKLDALEQVSQSTHPPTHPSSIHQYIRHPSIIHPSIYPPSIHPPSINISAIHLPSTYLCITSSSIPSFMHPCFHRASQYMHTGDWTLSFKCTNHPNWAIPQTPKIHFWWTSLSLKHTWELYNMK